MPVMNADVKRLWFSIPNIFYLLPIPLATLVMFVLNWRNLHKGDEYSPFFLSMGIFLTGYLGLGISVFPWLVPFAVSFRQAAAAPESQSLLLVGTVVLLPVILGYVAYCYYIFRGKTSDEAHY